jgi:hypothetical protein
MGRTALWEKQQVFVKFKELLIFVTFVLFYHYTVFTGINFALFLKNTKWRDLFIYFIHLTPMCIGYIHHFLYLVFIILIS